MYLTGVCLYLIDLLGLPGFSCLLGSLGTCNFGVCGFELVELF